MLILCDNIFYNKSIDEDDEKPYIFFYKVFSYVVVVVFSYMILIVKTILQSNKLCLSIRRNLACIQHINKLQTNIYLKGNTLRSNIWKKNYTIKKLLRLIMNISFLYRQIDNKRRKYKCSVNNKHRKKHLSNQIL